jgi:hypothetical protein
VLGLRLRLDPTLLLTVSRKDRQAEEERDHHQQYAGQEPFEDCNNRLGEMRALPFAFFCQREEAEAQCDPEHESHCPDGCHMEALTPDGDRRHWHSYQT